MRDAPPPAYTRQLQCVAGVTQFAQVLDESTGLMLLCGAGALTTDATAGNRVVVLTCTYQGVTLWSVVLSAAQGAVTTFSYIVFDRGGNNLSTFNTMIQAYGPMLIPAGATLSLILGGAVGPADKFNVFSASFAPYHDLNLGKLPRFPDAIPGKNRGTSPTALTVHNQV